MATNQNAHAAAGDAENFGRALEIDKERRINKGITLRIFFCWHGHTSE